MANKFDEMISKSLDEIDALVEDFKKSVGAEDEDTISKAQNDEDLSADEVSNDTPSDEEDTDREDEAQNDEPEETQEDTDEDSEGEEDADQDEEYQKSLADELSSNSSVRKALEVSEFLQELVKSLDKVVSTNTENIRKSFKESYEFSNGLLAKSVEGIVKAQRAVLETQAELLKSVRALNKRVKALESQPVVRKSVASNAQVVEKSFKASVGDKPQANNTLTKSQASAKLLAAYESGQADLLDDILALDGTGNFNVLSDKAKSILGLL
jgi:cobalamin biosynthesis protein CobT